MLTVGSLFSGIGGFDLGLERAGMSVRWQVENNGYCNRVLAKHWPDVPRYGDIKAIDWQTVEAVDLVCGGFPCQPFSLAGKQRGKEDDRYLWPEVVRCLDALRPTWFLGENVPGIINLALDQVCADLESLGYTVWPVCVPACAVDAPHQRQRVWIVAHPQHGGCGEAGAEGASSGHLAQCGSDVADAERQGLFSAPHTGVYCQEESAGARDVDVERRNSLLADAFLQQRHRWGDGVGWWEREPRETLQALGGSRRQEDVLSIPESLLGRVAHGVPARVDRLRGLGNAIVPQVAEVLGSMIVQQHLMAEKGPR